MQDVPQPRHRAQQGREPSVFRYLQLLRIPSFRRRHQDRFPFPDRPQKACGLSGWCCAGNLRGEGLFVSLPYGVSLTRDFAEWKRSVVAFLPTPKGLR
jgi:hypothetical protein